MIQIFKNLGKYWKAVLLIFLLLVIQAYCDLALPQYTSDIIDVGIQDGGIKHILPEKILKTEYDYVTLFMKEEEEKAFTASYEEKADCYECKDLSEKELEKLDASLIVAILIDYQMEAVEAESFKENIWNNEQISAKLQAAGMTKDIFMEMSVDDIGDMLHVDITAFEKELKDEEGNLIATTCVDMRSLIKNMIDTGMMDESTMNAERDTFQKMSDSIGGNTLQSMGVAWVAEREKEAGIDMDQKQTGYLWIEGGKMLLLALLMGVVSIFESLLATRVGAGVGRDLREKVFHKVVGFTSAEMDHFSTASLITRSTNDVQQIQMVTIMLLHIVLYAPIIGVGGVIKVIKTGAGMGWVIGLAVILIVGLVMALMSVTMPKFKVMQKLVDEVNLVSREILTGLSVIRAFGREKKEEERFDEANRNLLKTQLFTNRVMNFMMPGMMTIMYAIDILIVWVAAHRIDEGLLQVGSMTAFITYAMQIVMSFLMLTMLSIMLPRAGVAAERIQEVIDTEVSVKDIKRPQSIEKQDGVLSFEHVNFRYPGAKEDVLSDIDFTAKPGQITAVIGSTGCGKSTLVNLIPRLYDVTDGRITIDGRDIREISMEDLRSEIGFVPQKAVLFSGTIASNLRFGNKNASLAEIEEAAAIAQVKEFIDSKEQGYDSPIAQGGSNVSGGQRQRLAIARAIVKKPKVFVFDDSFSALDMKTDVKLREALASKVKDSTVLIVAQRISTILHADRILVLDDGKIVGEGTHEELLRSCEVYEQIARSQMSAKELGLEEKTEISSQMAGKAEEVK
ncbi:MAG: ABC transporter ATP-binding protein/permease [Lachnospiraceae bacterium]|nr:ABC transporter ATP-binding protein/permease [Lachnospiraceae bacterium]